MGLTDSGTDQCRTDMQIAVARANVPPPHSSLTALNTFSMSMFHFLPHDILHCIRLTFFFALSIPLDTRPFDSPIPPYTLTR